MNEAKGECKEAGVLVPVIDRNRCEGKADCVEVCPYDVFEVGPMDETQFAAMPMLIKIKLWAHGKQTAFSPRADACRACALCVAACPERAIRLVRS